MAATRAAVNLGSGSVVVLAADAELTVPGTNGALWIKLDSKRGSSIFWEPWRPKLFDWLWKDRPKTGGAGTKLWGKFVERMLLWSWALWNWGEFCLWVRSSITVGIGAEAESVAKQGELESELARKIELTGASALWIDPVSTIDTAADVVDTIAFAAGGSGWLWWPS